MKLRRRRESITAIELLEKIKKDAQEPLAQSFSLHEYGVIIQTIESAIEGLTS